MKRREFLKHTAGVVAANIEAQTTFGRITGAGSARVIQLNARLSF